MNLVLIAQDPEVENTREKILSVISIVEIIADPQAEEATKKDMAAAQEVALVHIQDHVLAHIQDPETILEDPDTILREVAIIADRLLILQEDAIMALVNIPTDPNVWEYLD